MCQSCWRWQSPTGWDTAQAPTPQQPSALPPCVCYWPVELAMQATAAPMCSPALPQNNPYGQEHATKALIPRHT